MGSPASVAYTERGLDRLIIFTDAVVAIAATFLIVPVIDLYGDAISIMRAPFVGDNPLVSTSMATK